MQSPLSFHAAVLKKIKKNFFFFTKECVNAFSFKVN